MDLSLDGLFWNSVVGCLQRLEHFVLGHLSHSGYLMKAVLCNSFDFELKEALEMA